MDQASADPVCVQDATGRLWIRIGERDLTVQEAGRHLMGLGRTRWEAEDIVTRTFYRWLRTVYTR